MEGVSVEGWVATQLGLLRLEQQAEAEELRSRIDAMSPRQAQDKGVSLLDLELESTRAALLGRLTLTLLRRDESKLPAHSFKVGDEVKLSSRKAEEAEDKVFGIVSSISSTRIEIISEIEEMNLIPPFRLDLFSSEQTFKKMVETLQSLPQMTHPMINLLFHNAEIEISTLPPIVPFNASLNTSQVEAVQHALATSPCALIHGPPGTPFKTSTILVC